MSYPTARREAPRYEIQRRGASRRAIKPNAAKGDLNGRGKPDNATLRAALRNPIAKFSKSSRKILSPRVYNLLARTRRPCAPPHLNNPDRPRFCLNSMGGRSAGWSKSRYKQNALAQLGRLGFQSKVTCFKPVTENHALNSFQPKVTLFQHEAKPDSDPDSDPEADLRGPKTRENALKPEKRTQSAPNSLSVYAFQKNVFSPSGFRKAAWWHTLSRRSPEAFPQPPRIASFCV